MLKLVPKWLQNGALGGQTDPWDFKMLKMELSGPWEPPGAPKGGGQEGQVGPKRGSKELKMRPRWFQGSPKRIQDGPKGAQRELKGSPRAAKDAKKGPRWRLQRCKKWKS